MMKVLVSAGILMLAFACATATNYTVGDDLGWTGPPNITAGYYDSWAANKTFQGGRDALRFVLNGTHNVAMVSKQDYDNCTTKEVSYFFAVPLDYWFNFPVSGNTTYYFICTVDSHCKGGMKLAVDVIGTYSASSRSSVIAAFVSGASAMISLAALFVFA